jgi:murein DD-endopeptidase MepM/ murein hydrolase activator NlpD
MAQKKCIHKITKKEQKTLHDRLDSHMCAYYHKHFHITHHSHHHFAHMGELILILLVWCMSRIFAGNVWLPSNTSFVYPLQQVSTIDCRAQQWEQLEDDCKLNLPRIANANYAGYKDSTIHRQIYTVLRAAPYKAGRDQHTWAHAWVDIATARGTPLQSIGDGQVTYAWRQNGYGNVVKIKYLFKWQYIHAIYAHMDIIQVEAGQKISAGQRIGTVGNSGTTFWALGWFHVHFEITKDNHGRPMYAYNGCPDLAKGHMTIIQNGLCREQLFNHQYDPIVLFEQNRLWYNISEVVVEDSEIIEDPIQEPEEIIIPEETVTPPLQEEVVVPVVLENPGEIVVPTQPEEEVTEEVAPIEEIVHPAPQPEVITNPIQTDEIIGRIGEKIEFDTTDLSDEVKHFFITHDMYINNHTGRNTITVGWYQEIEINFYRKGIDTKFVWILPFILELIPSQTSIVTDINSLQLISPNPSIIKIQWITPWRSALILSIDNDTIYKILYTIQ